MKYLAINTAGIYTEVLVKDGEKRYYRRIEDRVKTSECLLPALDELLDEAGLGLRELDCLCCVTGPGSFTGIRIGVNTVRTFGYTLSKPVAGINYLEVLAYNNMSECESLITLVDGSNGTCYMAAYTGELKQLLAPCCLTCDQAKTLVAMVDEPCVIVADEKMRPLFAGARGEAGDGYALQRAAEAKIRSGELTDYSKLEPLYIRKSQPERREGDL